MEYSLFNEMCTLSQLRVLKWEIVHFPLQNCTSVRVAVTLLMPIVCHILHHNCALLQPHIFRSRELHQVGASH